MKKTVLRAAIVSLCLWCALCGCEQNGVETETPLTSAPATILGRLPEKILTAEVVADTVGLPMEAGVIEDDGEYLVFAAADGAGRVVIAFQEAGRQYFEDLIAVNYDAETILPIEALGEAAWWSPDTDEVVAFDRDCIVSVQCTVDGVDPRDAGIRLMSVVLFNLSLSA